MAAVGLHTQKAGGEVLVENQTAQPGAGNGGTTPNLGDGRGFGVASSGEVVKAMQTPDDGSVVLPRRRQVKAETIRARAERLQEELRLKRDTPSLAVQQVYQVKTQSEFDHLSQEERAQ